MSASCIVHRGQVLDLLEEIRQSLPARSARPTRSSTSATASSPRPTRTPTASSSAPAPRPSSSSSQEWVHAAAVREAELIRSDAEAEAARMRREVDDYVDGKLANFEIALQKTLMAVERGRDKIRARTSRSSTSLARFPADGRCTIPPKRWDCAVRLHVPTEAVGLLSP